MTCMKMILAVLACICMNAAHATIKLPSFISDSMVLQRNIKVPIWGWASPGSAIRISFHGKNYQATSAADGKWMVKLASMTAGGPFDMSINGDGETLVIKNILIGDVWVCSGQSNMSYDFMRVQDLYANEIASSANNKIRLITFNRTTGSSPQADCKSTGWIAASPQNILKFSAAGYFFGKEIHEKYGVPIGLISTNWGGTHAEAWTSEEGLENFPQFTSGLQFLHDTAAVNKRKETNKKWQPNNLPTALFNGMVAPLIPYAIKGVIWYQGEGNAPRAHEYRILFPAMINDWRKQWGQGSFPFVFQQLVNFKAVKKDHSNSDWAELREAQFKTLKLPNTAMSVGIDIGEEKDIHPHNKKDIGHRLALGAERIAYGDKQLVFSGPLYSSMKKQGNKIVIRFNNTGSGLTTKDGAAPNWFSIAGPDQKFEWAKAVIKGNTVEVWSDAVANPVAVRYAWADNPDGCNLVNKEGLPASPFRTDNWPGVTDAKVFTFK